MPGASSRISRDGFVLVVVDVQDKLAAAMQRRDGVVAATARLVRLAGIVAAPVIVTRQYPEGLGDTVPEIREAVSALAGDSAVAVIDKLAFCACLEAGFDDALASAGRAQVVVAGMETHICVTQTALALSEAGYDVHVVADGTCSRRDADHQVALDRLRSAGIVVTTSESVIYEAVGMAGTNEFRRVLSIVKGA